MRKGNTDTLLLVVIIVVLAVGATIWWYRTQDIDTMPSANSNPPANSGGLNVGVQAEGSTPAPTNPSAENPY